MNNEDHLTNMQELERRQKEEKATFEYTARLRSARILGGLTIIGTALGGVAILESYKAQQPASVQEITTMTTTIEALRKQPYTSSREQTTRQELLTLYQERLHTLEQQADVHQYHEKIKSVEDTVGNIVLGGFLAGGLIIGGLGIRAYYKKRKALRTREETMP